MDENVSSLKPSKRVTMMDVAKAAGCSQATVSVVLNNTTEIKISAELRARVVEAARALGYGEKSLFRRAALEELRGGCIGFIVDQLATTPEAVNAIEGARQESWEADVTILVAQTQGRAEHERRAVERLLRAGAQGIVYMSIFTRRVALDPIFERLPVPLVLLNCYTTDGRFPAVVPDEINGGRLATTTLIEKGHRRIGIIAGESFMEAAQDRLIGYRKALRKAGIAYDDDLVAQGSWTPTSGFEATQQLLALTDRPTAIFCQNDKMAWGCMTALREAGLSVPGDISVIGYDDDELARHLRPQLTTLDLPHRAMGAWAIRQLDRHPPGQPPVKAQANTSEAPHKVACTLITRESVSTFI
ncbi:LacI family transcriptional regulator [Xaviernesmea oryzae]|uniref:LacI family transcriptional regulator n=1 Tax=Xaviernesmea oryzae TaxID=464029 RepID=A0A1Q9B219_9HYPH|nr:LacI family DNA-binding transcriptional regulator [Xaviernesmea oryzae]OLP62036.1 LacI family transcriptional regulator [Xaviernesmea oryzae]SEK96022.1 transcriptional regulator, LacI family [Xaviernesmea oryzae]